MFSQERAKAVMCVGIGGSEKGVIIRKITIVGNRVGKGVIIKITVIEVGMWFKKI